MRGRRKVGMAAVCLLLALAGCDGAPSAADGAGPSGGPSAAGSGAFGGRTGDAARNGFADAKEETLLKVMYVNEPSFYEEYGNLFAAKYPFVEFQVIALSETRGEGDALENFKRVLEERRPDVVLMNESIYEALSAEGRLLDLEAPMRSEGDEAPAMLEGVETLLRARGGGRLYGLADTFRSKALYYNKNLLEALGLPYPTDGMSWEEVLLLSGQAARADADGERSGLSLGLTTRSAFELVYALGQSRGLTLFDAEAKTLLLDTEGWRSAFADAVAAYRERAVSVPVNPFVSQGDGSVSVGLGAGNAFVGGRAAMAVDDVSLLHLLDSMGRMRDGETFEWGLATFPVSPERPGTTTAFELTRIFGVAADSPNAAAAWAFVRFVHAEETMRMRSKSSYELIASESGAAGRGGRDLTPFYRLVPDVSVAAPLVPSGFTTRFERLADEAIASSVSGERTADEALEWLQRNAGEELRNFEGDKREPFSLGRDAYLR